ncbi:MAG: cell division protein FtsQ/DivIB [Candidatus Competibacteraceae bacterium]|nr:cell division protein FtsQ/DivIB [Candidatus Competibacteraceae bacterium]
MGFKRGKRHGATPLKPQEDQALRRWLNWRLWLRWTGVAMVLAGIGAGLYSAGQRLLDPEQFPLRHVRLNGELRNLDEADLRALLETQLGQNFFALDIDAIHAAFAANPWIREVRVQRQWPDTLRINFHERSVFGYWGEDEMIDINGQRFRPANIRQTGVWPRLAGPDGHEIQLMNAYREATALLKSVGLQLTRLVQDERRAWWMELANGLELSLGREHFDQRLRRFIDIYPRILAEQIDRIAMVDLRYVNGFAVRWADSTETNDSRRISRASPKAKYRAHSAG